MAGVVVATATVAVEVATVATTTMVVEATTLTLYSGPHFNTEVSYGVASAGHGLAPPALVFLDRALRPCRRSLTGRSSRERCLHISKHHNGTLRVSFKPSKRLCCSNLLIKLIGTWNLAHPHT
jgi:hypothetical protein